MRPSPASASASPRPRHSPRASSASRNSASRIIHHRHSFARRVVAHVPRATRIWVSSAVSSAVNRPSRRPRSRRPSARTRRARHHHHHPARAEPRARRVRGRTVGAARGVSAARVASAGAFDGERETRREDEEVGSGKDVILIRSREGCRRRRRRRGRARHVESGDDETVSGAILREAMRAKNEFTGRARRRRVRRGV